MTKMNLSDLTNLQLGALIEGDLLIKTARKAMTNGKVRKPYINITATDGVQSTTTNVWNWTAEKIPQPNDIVFITATVGEYNGNRQLNVDSLTRSNSPITDFMPTGDFNIDAYWERLKTLVSNVRVPIYRQILEHYMTPAYEELWRTIPSALGFHHDCVAGNLWHSVDTCNNAMAIYTNYVNVANIDLVITAALLHDIGKLETYRLNGATIEMTTSGQLLDHITLGIISLQQFKDVAIVMEATEALELLVHCVASHHGKLEYGSPVSPKCIEAIIVNYADGIDAKARNYIDLNKVTTTGIWTGKMYMLDNRPMLTSGYVYNSILGDDDNE